MPTKPPKPETIAADLSVPERVLASPDRVAMGMSRPELVPSLLLQFLHPMLLIIGNGCGERHDPRHVEVSEGDNECFPLFQRHDMAHDATFVAGI